MNLIGKRNSAVRMWGDENFHKIGLKNPLSFFLLQSP